jgi:hypothetical protein
VARVREVDPHSDPRWDEFVAAHPDGIVYQHSAWLRCLEAEYGRPSTGLCCEDAGGQVVGLMPVVATRGVPLLGRSALLGPRVSSLPRTPLAGPLALDRDGTAALVGAAIALARRRGRGQLQIKRAASDLDGIQADLVGAPWRTSYVVSLPDDPERLRFGNSRNHSRIKWAVNKARGEGVEVREASTLADVEAWYRLYLETMRDVLVPPRPLRLFACMWRELVPRGLMTLYLAERQEAGGAQPTLIGGSIVLGLGRTAFYAFNGRRSSALPLRPNEVIQWSAIHDACRRGFDRYDLGEVTGGNVGLADFKRKWGGDEVRLHRYYDHPVDPDASSGPSGVVRRAGEKVWARAPLPLIRMAGDLAYRWL